MRQTSKAKNSQSFATRAIHHGYEPLENEGSLTPPIHMTSTFVFETTQQGSARFAGEEAGHVYSRKSNPTLDLLERRIAVLDGAEAGLALSSGIWAVTSAMWTLLSPGDELIFDKTLYGCTFSFLHHGLAKFGIKINHVDLTNNENLQNAISDQTRLVYFDTPVNPNMRLVDIAAVSEIAHAAEALVMVDNTYSTPYLTRPIELGADIVVHSATKYLSGHGDVITGLLVGDFETVQKIRLFGMKDMTGAVMSPFNAAMVLRGIKTLELRMDRHCKSAMEIARRLEKASQISRVWPPGLPSFKQHELAKQQISDFGGMIAFELKGGLTAGQVMIDAAKMIHCAVSLGDTETLIQHPASMTHSTYTPEERAAHDISDGLVRLSIGLEGMEDIWADLEQMLAAVERWRATEKTKIQFQEMLA